jgi:Holliday junction DNA helicase RuvA
MIATVRGEITQIEGNAVIVEVGGWGVRVQTPLPLQTRLHVGMAVLLYTHLVVREDAWSLYGFETQAERDLFTLLLSVDGVGPRTALALLSGASLDTIQRAIFQEDAELLSRLPGIGRKTAQKIVLSLHDRLKPSSVLENMAGMSDADSEVLAALTALGYSVVEAQMAIQSLPPDAPADVEERLRLALRYFGGKQS